MKKLIRHTEGYYTNLLNKGFSIIPIQEYKDNHKPNLFSTTPFYTDAANLLQFDGWYKDKKTVSFGLLTGQSDVEAIDIDSKILKTKQDRDSFLKEYFGLLENHIDDFYKKFCIVKTQSGGFHILYKSKLVTGNKKIAKPKGYKEALIESRGLKGFVYIYNVVKGLQYNQIDYVSDEDRKMLWQISETYDYKEVIQPKAIKKRQTITQDGLTPWDDFASKNSILDICSDDFDIVKHGKKSTMIRRKGADSAFSGHIYDDTGKMFLYSTGTIYPHETPLNSFDVYVFKHYGGDRSEATKQAYSDGYGDRYKPTNDKPITEVTPLINTEFPLHIFPKAIQQYVTECNQKLNASVDFMCVSYLWLMSVLIGNTLKVKVKNGWIDSPILWISVIGTAGVGKTPDIKLILKPLLDLNSQEIKRNIKRQKEYKEYQNMSKEDKEVNGTKEEPIKTQMIVDDITMESLIDMHSYNPKSIGVFKDELAGWFKDMNKYRDGSDKERFLSAWSGDSIVLNRKTADDSFVESPFIPILGGIQPSIFKEFQTSENKHNGFMDRMLFCDPKKEAQYPPTEELSQDLINQYRDVIIEVKKVVDRDLTEVVEGVCIPKVLELTPGAKKEYNKSHRALIDLMKSEDELSNHVGMFAKQITYIPRFALILEFVSNIYNDSHASVITEKSIKDATELSNYFISMAKNNNTESKQGNSLSSYVTKHKDKSIAELSKMTVKQFPNVKKKDIADSLDISVRTLHRYTK
jgi:hypothetical protein